MTKPRAPYTLADAVTEIIGAVSVDLCAHALERSTGLLRQWADPDNGAKPSMAQCIVLDAAFRNHTDTLIGPIQRYYECRVHRRLTAPQGAKDPEGELWDVLEASARLTLGMREALGDGILNMGERRLLREQLASIRKEIDEAAAALAQSPQLEAAE